MLDGGAVFFGAELGDEIFELPVCELSSIVGYQCLWYSKSGKHVSLVEAEYIVCYDFGKGLVFNPLSKIVNDDDQVFFYRNQWEKARGYPSPTKRMATWKKVI